MKNRGLVISLVLSIIMVKLQKSHASMDHMVALKVSTQKYVPRLYFSTIS